MFAKMTEPPAETGDQATRKEVTLGAFLKEARLSQGLDLAAVANETRVNLKNLVALEEDDRARLPADVFSRGFVRIYAAYLKLDPQEAIRLYEKQWGVSGSTTGSLIAKRLAPLPSRPGIFMSLLVIALFFGVRFYYPGGGDLPGSGEQGGANRQEVSSSSGQDGKEAAFPGPPAAEQNLTAPTPVEVTSAKGTAAPPSSAYEIGLHTTHQLTIKLSLDGQTAVEKTLLPGTSQSWRAAQGFALTLDRADGVQLTVNGALVPIKTEPGQTITIERP